MKIPNPNNPVFIQRNKGERDPSANIAGSWNCDFSSKPGKVLPSVPLELQVSQEDTAALKPIVAMAAWDAGYSGDGPYWGVSSGGDVWEGPANGIWAQDANTGTPTTTNESDIVSFDGDLFVSESTTDDVAKQSTNTWDGDWFTTLTGTPSLATGPFVMETIRVGSQLLAIADSPYIHTVTIDGTVSEDRLRLDNELKITWIRSGTSRAFIGGVMKRQNDRVVVYEWDGGDTVPTRQYLLETRGVFSAVVMDDTLYVLTYEMELKVLAGGGFKTVAQFPITKERFEVFDYDGTGYTDTVAVPRAMVVLNGKILINIGNLIEAGTVLQEKYVPYFPSGVWEFNPETGSLTHKHSYTTETTRDGDYGQWTCPVATDVHPGAIIPVVDTEGDSTIVVSGTYYIDEGTTSGDYVGLYADIANTTTKRRARLWTNQIFTNDTAALFHKISLKYGKMKNAGDKIAVKYRTEEDANYPILAAVTWTDTDTFTTTSSISNAVVGDEVFVLCGPGGGSSAHISSITVDGGTYTVNLDEAVYGVAATNESSVVIENWKKLVVFNDQKTTYKEFSLPVAASTWIQVMVELRGDGGDSPILEEIDIIPTKQQ